MTLSTEELLEGILDGNHRALARAITKIENRQDGYREIVSGLYEHTGSADVIGVTGSPGAGKSTLVDKMAKTYRDRGLTVGIVAIDPSSPYTGGAVLGDRIRMASNVGDMDVFFRSMSARGSLGGLSTATADAVKALDAFGKDKVIIETVGAGQNEIDIVRAADTVAVLVPPESGDNVQMLKAGILEIADVFAVNKADMDGADRTVQELEEMVHMDDGHVSVAGGHHGMGIETDVDMPETGDESADAPEPWKTPVLETVATSGEGVDEFLATLQEHADWLAETGQMTAKRRQRTAEEIRTLLREDAAALVAGELEDHGGVDALADSVLAGDTDPYSIADDVLAPVAECLDED
ncbi:methylmalonyl Co-A mutase-associated GTPase MeaB [Halorubellus sp. JP-L1]|uniref:methylmalonyl Co-A mutase-associated GTPase MeaB n=1 Tax=Halorubellus sp. JP-L1 TaxID=2715753 RepID=UPI001408DF87|nr:methylmalonyl Co-A mutase-associated GTPase MeaB [Halorubellus sp. JP-L1]NHN40153.1 methylmalonyl Co-A mutase-associated GTPase MeaB [Halorubellus sp. JP-L1]